MEFAIWLALFVVALLVVQSFFKNTTRMRQLKALPGLKPIFLVGNIAWILRLYWKKTVHHPGVYILERIRAYSILFSKQGMYIFWVGSEPIVPVFCPELTEAILSSRISLEKSFEYTLLHRWLGTGLLTSTGPKWSSRRKLLTPCFHFRILEDFLPTFNEQSMVLVNKLHQMRHEEYVDITPLIILCTLDIVCETVMGARIGAQEGSNFEYVNAIHNLGDFFNKRTCQPWLFYDFLFALTPTGKAFDRDLKVLLDFTKKVIKDKKESRLQETKVKGIEEKDDEIGYSGKKRQALMDLLLDLHINEDKLSEEDIQEEVDTFMFEGHDTTAMGIIFALYCIGLYPEVQKNIHDELDAIFLGDNTRPITMDDTRDMKYMECAIKESQRIYPSVPVIGRKLEEDVKYKEFIIPKGTIVHCNIFCLHKNSDVYPNPEVYDPDRFSQDNSLNKHPFAFVPFSAGPRNCIGQKFALLEEKIIICNILRQFKVVSLDQRDQFHCKMEFTLRPCEAVRMKFYPRTLKQ